MCEMGFEEDLNYILDAIGTNESLKRQTMMFSATLPLQVDRLARKYLDKPITITIGHGTPITIDQRIEMIQPAQKFAKLQQILKQFDTQCIVFVNSRKECDVLAGLLGSANCLTLHGGKNQTQREDALKQFKEGRRDVMIATDVAGRGVDVKGLGLVVNYDMAKTVEGIYPQTAANVQITRIESEEPVELVIKV
jgi:ATP-dependent RNA helicase DDX23/PRP28